MRVLIPILIVSLFVASAAQAQLVVGSDDSTAPTIFYVNINTGAATPLLAAPEAEVWGLANDASTNTLYWNNGVTLFSSPFGPTLVPTNLGNIQFMGADTNMVGLAFSGGLLFGTRNTADEAVYQINPATLEATIAYNYTDADFDFGGIDFDATDGRMYGSNDDTTPFGSGLFFIDLVGMTQSLRAPYPLGESDIDGLAVHDGIAYYVIDQPGVISVVHIASGTIIGTLPSPFPTSEVFSGAAFVPDADGDFVADSVDNCPMTANTDQADADSDGRGDACDLCVGNDASGDVDGDGVCTDVDPCPLDNPDDSDGDGVCDIADFCPGADDTVDADGNGVADCLAALGGPAGQPTGCCAPGLFPVIGLFAPFYLVLWRRGLHRRHAARTSRSRT